MTLAAVQAVSSPAASAPARWPVTKYRLDSPPTGETFEFVASSRTSADGLFKFVWTLAPGKRGPGDHYHEAETETFHVVSGVLRIWIDGVPADYHPGEVAVLRPGMRHHFLNPGKVPAVVNVSLDGPRMEDMFVPAAVAVAGRKPRIVDVLRMFVIVTDTWPSTPSRAIERAVFRGLVGLLKLLGMRRYEPVHGWDVSAAS